MAGPSGSGMGRDGILSASTSTAAAAATDRFRLLYSHPLHPHSLIIRHSSTLTTNSPSRLSTLTITT